MIKVGLILSALVLILGGCGDVTWFPAYHRLPTTPDPFSFPSKTGVSFSATGTTTVTSAPITVSGLAADSTSPISISGPSGSNSQYIVSGGTPTSAAGTVKNGDTVIVSQTVPNAPATSVASTLSIGVGNQAQSATFTSITANVETFALTGTGLAGQIANSGPHPLLVASGTYTVSITGGTYSFDNVNYSALAQILTLTNGATNIYLTSTVPSVTTVIIDGVASTFTTTVR